MQKKQGIQDRIAILWKAPQLQNHEDDNKAKLTMLKIKLTI